MVTITYIILTFVWTICIILLVRNNQVHAYRMKVINWVYAEGIDREELEKRRDYYHSISYNEMVNKFWVPINKFYNLDL